eukprot:3626388-Pleurochrysis_carterae.AAC.3
MPAPQREHACAPAVCALARDARVCDTIHWRDDGACKTCSHSLLSALAICSGRSLEHSRLPDAACASQPPQPLLLFTERERYYLQYGAIQAIDSVCHLGGSSKRQDMRLCSMLRQTCSE